MEIISKKNGRREMDLVAVALLLLRRAWLIVIAAAIGAAASLVWSRRMTTPEYEATTLLYVSNNPETAELRSITTSDISASMMLMGTCAEIIKNETAMEQVIARSGVAYSPAQLMRMLQVYGVDNTKILTVTAVSDDPEEAALLANTVAELAPDLMKSVEAGCTIRLLDRAKVPTSSVSLSKSKTILVGAVIGAFLAVALILGSSILDTNIKTKKDLLALGYPLLGVIPADAVPVRAKRGGKSAEPVQKIDSKALIDAQKTFQQIEESIRFSLPGAQCKKILFAGLAPEDSTCMVAVNLTMAMSSKDHSVLLMDCDLRKKEAAKLLGLWEGAGVSDALAGQLAAERCVQHYREHLDVMTSGSFSPNPGKLLSSDEMKNMLDAAGESYEYIVLNTAPIGKESSVDRLHTFMSGIVLVLRTGAVKKELLRDTITKMEASGCRILGIIAASDKSL